MTELTDIAAGWALKDAQEKADHETRNRSGADHYDVACALRDLGFVIVKKEG